MTVTAQGKLHGAIFFTAGIEVDTREYHPLQHPCGRFTVPGALLLQPVSIAWNVMPSGYSDHPILMPGHTPIRPRSLVEGG